MPRHVIVDGSNLATEGRSMPSLKQLSDAVEAYMADHPDDLITVVVDATFGHRIDANEIPEFDAAIEHNEMVAPPAGAVGRGDGFVLAIANKVNAVVLSNDSYQEFHGQYDWLFDEGRLIGGKPVPHVGWVFVPRVPVRGPISRKSQRDARRGGRPVKDTPRETAGDNAVRSSAASNQPMPVPKAPPPGARPPRETKPPAVDAVPVAAVAKVAAPGRNEMVNDVMPFLEFVERRPVGSLVEATIEVYSSHGAYALAAGARVYLPLRNIADPPPRTARELFKIGETVELQVAAFHAARRGIDVAVPGIVAGLEVPSTTTASDAKPARRRGRTAAPAESTAASVGSSDDSGGVGAPDTPAVVRPSRRRGRADVEPAVDAPAAAAVRAVAGRRPRRSSEAVAADANVESASLTAEGPEGVTDADTAVTAAVEAVLASIGAIGDDAAAPSTADSFESAGLEAEVGAEAPAPVAERTGRARRVSAKQVEATGDGDDAPDSAVVPRPARRRLAARGGDGSDQAGPADSDRSPRVRAGALADGVSAASDASPGERRARGRGVAAGDAIGNAQPGSPSQRSAEVVTTDEPAPAGTPARRSRRRPTAATLAPADLVGTADTAPPEVAGLLGPVDAAPDAASPEVAGLSGTVDAAPAASPAPRRRSAKVSKASPSPEPAAASLSGIGDAAPAAAPVPRGRGAKVSKASPSPAAAPPAPDGAGDSVSPVVDAVSEESPSAVDAAGKAASKRPAGASRRAKRAE